MTVFKGYFLIIKRNILVILMYILLFIIITTMIQNVYNESQILEGFTSLKLKTAVIDRDGGFLGAALQKLLDREQQLVTLPDDAQTIQEQLYYGEVQYVLVVPEGTEELLASSEDAAALVQSIVAPGSVTAFYVDSQVNTLLNQIRVCLAAGYPMEEACRLALSLGEQPAKTTLVDVNGNAGRRADYNYFFAYMPYAFLSASIMALSTVIMEFKKREVRRRMMSSSVSFAMQNFAAAAACAAVGAMVWGSCIVLQTFLYHGGIFRDANWILYLLNSVCCILVALSLAYLAGMLATNPGSLNGINNVISLGLCFLGGIFVPLEMLSGAVNQAAQLLPTWWYSTINGILGDYETLNLQMQKTVWQGYAMQLLFAAACFAVTLLIRKYQRQERA